MTDAREFVARGTAHQPQRFVIGEGETVDEIQTSGAWIASDTVAEIKR